MVRSQSSALALHSPYSTRKVSTNCLLRARQTSTVVHGRLFLPHQNLRTADLEHGRQSCSTSQTAEFFQRICGVETHHLTRHGGQIQRRRNANCKSRPTTATGTSGRAERWREWTQAQGRRRWWTTTATHATEPLCIHRMQRMQETQNKMQRADTMPEMWEPEPRVRLRAELLQRFQGYTGVQGDVQPHSHPPGPSQPIV